MTPAELDTFRMPGGPLRQFSMVGSYPVIYLCRGSALCAQCATEAADEGEPVEAAGAHFEGDPIQCDRCSDEVESAYGATPCTAT